MATAAVIACVVMLLERMQVRVLLADPQPSAVASANQLSLCFWTVFMGKLKALPEVEIRPYAIGSCL